jgi:hypothetical protein
MALAELTKQLAIDALTAPAAKPAAPAAPDSVSATMLGEIHAMQRLLKDDEELVVFCHAGGDNVRVLQIIVPSSQVFVLIGIDKDRNPTRVITPVDAAQFVCRVTRVAPGSKAARINVVIPKPKPE